MRKKATIVATAMFGLCAIIVWSSASSGTQITGTISSDDLTAITSLVHRTNERRPILPDYSWQSLRQFPQAIFRPRDRIISIAASNSVVQVEALLAAPREKGLTRGVTYTLQKSSKSWGITAHQFWIGPESLR